MGNLNLYLISNTFLCALFRIVRNHWCFCYCSCTWWCKCNFAGSLCFSFGSSCNGNTFACLLVWLQLHIPWTSTSCYPFPSMICQQAEMRAATFNLRARIVTFLINVKVVFILTSSKISCLIKGYLIYRLRSEND